MMNLDEIMTLIRKGLWDDAISRVAGIEDSLEKVQVLIFIATEIYSYGDLESALEVLGDAEYYSNKIKDTGSKAIAYANLGFAYAVFGDYDSSGELFVRALDMVDRLRRTHSSSEIGEILGYVAHYLGMAGMIEDSLEQFEKAFDLIVNSKIGYVQKLDLLIKLGDLMVESGDYLNSKEALRFYERAHDLFDKLRVSEKAADVEKKIEICKTLLHSGTPTLRNALKEGRYKYAAAKVMESEMVNKEKAIALLEISFWLKKVEVFTYGNMVDKALELLNISELQGEEVEYIAFLLSELGKPKEALKLAATIDDVRKKSEAFKGIALALIEEGEILTAEELIKKIPDPIIRAEAEEEFRKIMLAR
ncbi:hypothetical protein [Palaeococcus sp. (in: euryarchaeotes)]